MASATKPPRSSARTKQRLEALARDSAPVLQVLAEQSGQFTCLFAGLVKAEDDPEKVFGRDSGGPGVHITFEAVQDNGGYTTGQEPKYGDIGGGRLCYGLPPNQPVIPFTLYYNPTDGYFDGVPVDPYTGKPPCTHAPCSEPRSSRANDWSLLLTGPVSRGG